MSKYTTEVRFICETASGLSDSAGYNDIERIVEIAAPKIFNNFPIFDENYRSVLMKKILMHYYTREISEETVGLWKLRLASRMNEIMPYFNKLYESELLAFNPFWDVDLTTQRTSADTKVGSDKSTSNETGSGSTVETGNEQNHEEKDRTHEGTINETNAKTGNETNSKVSNGSVDTQIAQTDNKTKVGFSGTESEKNLTNNSTENITTGTDKTVSGSELTHSTDVGTDNTDTKRTNNTNITDNSTTTVENENSGTNTSTTGVTASGSTDTTDKSTDWTLYSDTPQGTISDIQGTGANHNMFLTNATEQTHDGETNTDTTNNSTTTYSGATSDTQNGETVVTGTNNKVETDALSSVGTNSNTKNGEKVTRDIVAENVDTEKTVAGTNVQAENSKRNDSQTENGGLERNDKTLSTQNDIGDTVYNIKNDRTIDRDYTDGTITDGDKLTNKSSSSMSNKDKTEESLTNINSTSDYAEHIFGKRGYHTYSKMLTEFRETFINIDTMVIEKLSDLFFNLW